MTSSLSIQKSTLHDEEFRYEQLSEAISSLPPEEGIRHLKSFLATYPSFAPAHNDLGILYLRSGKGTLALAHHEKATRLQPENVLFKKNLADFYAVELGWLDDAADIYLEVLRRNPRDIEAMMALGKLGEAMSSGGINREASKTNFLPVKTPDESPIVNPTNEGSKSEDELYMAARTLAANNETDAAIFSLESLIVRYPKNAFACNDLGVLLQQKEMFEKARNYLEKAVDLEPESVLYRKNLADTLYVGLGDLEAAMKQYLQLLSKNAKDVDVLRAISHVCIELGKFEDSVLFMERILAIQPWDQEIREALRKIKAINKMPVSTPPFIQQKTPDELYSEAREHLATERIEAARDTLYALVKASPENAMAHNDLGVLLVRLGGYQEALTSYERAVELEPSNNNYRKNLADLFMACLGRTDDAIFIYLDLLKKNPRDVETLTSLGIISKAVGRPEEAKTFFKRALEIEPWNGDVRTALKEMDFR